MYPTAPKERCRKGALRPVPSIIVKAPMDLHCSQTIRALFLSRNRLSPLWIYTASSNKGLPKPSGFRLHSVCEKASQQGAFCFSRNEVPLLRFSRLSSACFRLVISLSSACHQPVIRLSSACHTPPKVRSRVCLCSTVSNTKPVFCGK